MSVTVYVVVAEHDHETSHVIRCFLLKSVAEAFAVGCAAYDRLKPECPEIEDSAANDRLWERWQSAINKWQRRHPACHDTSHCDEYVVKEVELW